MRIRGMITNALMSIAVISRRGVDRVRAGHPWVYRSDVVSSDGRPGDLVLVLNERDKPLGWAFWSEASQISLRRLAGPSAGEALDERKVFTERLRQAIDYRASLGGDGSARRLVHGEADRLPALVVDKYADWLVLQTLSQGMDRRIGMIVELL